MWKRIFLRLVAISVLSGILVSAVVAFSLYEVFLERVAGDLRNEAELLTQYGGAYQDLRIENRLTLIAPDGEVIYDNQLDETTLQNHGNRREVREALERGTGADKRLSQTTGETLLYCAQKLTDGTVLRLSTTAQTALSMLLSLIPYFLAALCAALLCCFFVARHMARFVVQIQDEKEKLDAETMRRTFAANVSHELKTPLTSISGYAEIIENGLAKPEDMRAFGGRIHREAGRLMRLIEDIIRLSKLDEGAPETNVTFDAQKAFTAVCERFKPIADSYFVTLCYSCEAVVLRGDPALFEEMVFNLIDNAVKYNVRGGKAEATLRRESAKYALTVTDSGIGIPKDEQDKIFQRFYRVDKSRSKENGGTGLGLAIVKHAAQLLNGEIMLVSAPEKGTTIKVTFEGA